MLAGRLLEQHGLESQAILTDMYRLQTGRKPSAADLQVLNELLDAQLTEFTADPPAAKAYLAVGEKKRPSKNAARLAAFASVASALFAFDEALMRR